MRENHAACDAGEAADRADEVREGEAVRLDALVTVRESMRCLAAIVDGSKQQRRHRVGAQRERKVLKGVDLRQVCGAKDLARDGGVERVDRAVGESNERARDVQHPLAIEEQKQQRAQLDRQRERERERPRHSQPPQPRVREPARQQPAHAVECGDERDELGGRLARATRAALLLVVDPVEVVDYHQAGAAAEPHDAEEHPSLGHPQCLRESPIDKDVTIALGHGLRVVGRDLFRRAT
eukprot:704847-Prymnesium_polylepis.2